MYKICTGERSANRQRVFQDCLLEIMKTDSYQKASVALLCSKAGVTRNTFYKYFDSIHDVLYSIIDDELDRSWLYMKGTPQIAEYFEYWKDHKTFLDLLEANGLLFHLVDRSYHMACVVYNPQEYCEGDAEMITLVSGTVCSVCLWYKAGMKQDPQNMAEYVSRAFLNQLLTMPKKG